MTVSRLATLACHAQPLTAVEQKTHRARLRTLAAHVATLASARLRAARPSDRPLGAFRARGNVLRALAGSSAPAACTAAITPAGFIGPANTTGEFLRHHPAAVSPPRMRFLTSRGLWPRFGLAGTSRGLSAASSPMPRSPSASRRLTALNVSPARSDQLSPARTVRAAVFTATTCTTPLPGYVHALPCRVFCRGA